MFKRVCLLSGLAFLVALFASTGAAYSSDGMHIINADKHMFELSAVTLEEAEECFAAVFTARKQMPEKENVSGLVLADVWYKKYVMVFFAESGPEANPKTPAQLLKSSVPSNFDRLLSTAVACNERVKVVY